MNRGNASPIPRPFQGQDGSPEVGRKPGQSGCQPKTRAQGRTCASDSGVGDGTHARGRETIRRSPGPPKSPGLVRGGVPDVVKPDGLRLAHGSTSHRSSWSGPQTRPATPPTTRCATRRGPRSAASGSPTRRRRRVQRHCEGPAARLGAPIWGGAKGGLRHATEGLAVCSSDRERSEETVDATLTSRKR